MAGAATRLAIYESEDSTVAFPSFRASSRSRIIEFQDLDIAVLRTVAAIGGKSTLLLARVEEPMISGVVWFPMVASALN
jgi:hypothetical protein